MAELKGLSELGSTRSLRRMETLDSPVGVELDARSPASARRAGGGGKGGGTEAKRRGVEPFYLRLHGSEPPTYLTVERNETVVGLRMVSNALWVWDGKRLVNFGTGMALKLVKTKRDKSSDVKMPEATDMNPEAIMPETKTPVRVQSVEATFEGTEFELAESGNRGSGKILRHIKRDYNLHVIPDEESSWSGLGVQKVVVTSDRASCALWCQIKQSSIQWRLMCLCNRQYLQIDQHSGNAYTTHLNVEVENTLFMIDNKAKKITHAKTMLPLKIGNAAYKHGPKPVSLQNPEEDCQHEDQRTKLELVPAGDAVYRIVSHCTRKPLICWLKVRSNEENKYEVLSEDPLTEIYSLWMKVPMAGSYDWLSRQEDQSGKNLYLLNVENDVQDTWVETFGLDTALRRQKQREEKRDELKFNVKERQISLLTAGFSPGWAVSEFERDGCFDAYPNAVAIRLDISNLCDIDMIKGTFVFSAKVQVTYLKKEGKTKPLLEFINAADEKFAESSRSPEWQLFGDIYRYEFRIKNEELNENFELARFPFDVQDITIFFALNDPDRFPIMYHGTVKFKNESDEYEILTPTVDIYNTFGKNVKPIVAFRLRVHRKYYWYVINNMFPIGTMVSLTFAGFAVEPEFLGDRLAVVITLLLTAQATKLSVSDHLPKTSTVTVIDKYNLGSIFIVVLNVLEHIVAFEIGDTYGDTRFRDRFEWMALVIIGAMWILFNGITFCRVWRRLTVVKNTMGRPEEQVPANIPPRATSNRVELDILPGIF